MLKLSTEALANLPIANGWVNETNTLYTAFDPAYPKLRQCAKFPGVLFRICNSWSELIATCDGFAFESKHSTYANFETMLVGGACEDFLTHAYTNAHLYALGQRGITTFNSSTTLHSLMVPDPSAGYPVVDTLGQVTSSKSFNGVLEGKPTAMVDRVIGVVSNADWGYGKWSTDDLETGSLSAFTLVRRLPLSTVGRLMKDFVIPDMIASAGDATEVVSQACTEYLAQGLSPTIFSMPFMYTKYRDSNFVCGAGGTPVQVRELIGFPSVQPLACWGDTSKNVMSVAWWMYPRDNALQACVAPTYTPNDVVGGRALGDVLAGMLYLRNRTATGPFNDTPLTGVDFSVAVGKALRSLTLAQDEKMSGGLGAAGPLYNTEGFLLNPGSIAALSALPQHLRDVLDGPCGPHGIAEVLDDIKAIMKRADALAHAMG